MAHFQSEEEFQVWLRAKGMSTQDSSGEEISSRREHVSGSQKTGVETMAGVHMPKPYQRGRKTPKTEKLYRQHLELQRQAGAIVRYWHQPLKFILVHNIPGGVNSMTYAPDFLVQYPGHLRIVEIKQEDGFEHDDAKDKVKMACELFPCFQFVKVYVNTNTGEMREEPLT